MIENKLGEIVKEVLKINISETDEQMKFKDMEVWDSMTFMILVVKLEETFNISLTNNEILDIDCLQKTKEIIENKLGH